MVKIDKFIPADIPSEEDMKRYQDWLNENAIVYAADVKVKNISIDKRKTLIIQDLKLPGKYLECSAKFLFENFAEVHPIKLFNDEGILTLFFDDVLNPEIFTKQNLVIIKSKSVSKKKRLS